MQNHIWTLYVTIHVTSGKQRKWIRRWHVYRYNIKILLTLEFSPDTQQCLFVFNLCVLSTFWNPPKTSLTWNKKFVTPKCGLKEWWKIHRDIVLVNSNNHSHWRKSSSGIWRRVVLVRTDVSEERIASIFRAGKSWREYSEQVTAT
jgi:hypothetical protein